MVHIKTRDREGITKRIKSREREEEGRKPRVGRENTKFPEMWGREQQQQQQRENTTLRGQR